MLLRLHGSDVDVHGSHVVIRSPQNPTYRWGNFVLFGDPPGHGDLASWEAAFLSAFPAATHRAFGVDGTNGAAGAVTQFEAAGYRVELSTVMTAQAGDAGSARSSAAGCCPAWVCSPTDRGSRFQSVDTRPEARGRGLAGTLVHHASTYGFTELGASTLVMVADPEYLAIRLYRSVGFADTETQVGLERPPSPPHASAGRSAT